MTVEQILREIDSEIAKTRARQEEYHHRSMPFYRLQGRIDALSELYLLIKVGT